jgi:hypothetical protein
VFRPAMLYMKVMKKSYEERWPVAFDRLITKHAHHGTEHWAPGSRIRVACC